MSATTYSESQLVTNRVSLLLYGGNADERRAWAEEAARQFAHEGDLIVADSPAALLEGLVKTVGVLFIPDLLGVSEEHQRRIVQCLNRQDERPKLVLGLSKSYSACEASLREDLCFRLRQSHVNLTDAASQESIRKRRVHGAHTTRTKTKAQPARRR
ncbi:MAG: Fis family transcriptional regulator [Myxococcaceae bacterium]